MIFENKINMGTTLFNCVLVFCLLVGPTQLIGGLIRLSKLNSKSEYSNGLNRYFSFVVGYILFGIATTVVHNTLTNVESIGPLFLPILPLSIAIYYWRVIYSYDRSEINN